MTASQGTDPRNDVWIADLAASPADAPDLRVLQEGVDAATAPVFRNGRLYVWTNRDAPRGRLCVVPTDDFSYSSWQDLIPEDPEIVLSGFAFLDGVELDPPTLLVAHTRHAVSELALHDLGSGERRGPVALPGMGSVVELRDRRDGGCEVWFTYTDFTSPATVYRFDGRDGGVTAWARPPGAVTMPALATRQVEYVSKDGTTVRMFLLSRADLPAGPHPTVLYGYGGFNVSQTPYFSATAVAWVETGGVWAVANLRGGGEEGEQWHRAGMLANKQNVFDDFHAAADWLVDNAVTSPELLSIMGGSNGGLLVGAALTQRPEAYAAVVCSAPLLDMVRYERFGLGPTWAGEYGTVEDPEQLGWLLGYSPYHHVREGAPYPAVLFTVFDGDTRVDPLHARKSAAALQHTSTGSGAILLRRERDVGHSARSVSRTIALYADELAFLAAATHL
ncbi:prolyl oligopeptidase family serine peptidase [Phytohabitans flavus]|uniref:prolyl oligopeptidase family serine peptidase n=1 Tax=Phytohabitans flavus TaxID=1076124 RepID=UPI001E474709|nr:prolyl oligopeptidase family serine peptidase [Phytohabitans flavus]